MVLQALAVGVGAALGAIVRWRLGVLFNPIFGPIPLGTLAANLIGGFLAGICMEYFARNAALPPEVRLAATTGFVGGLTTFFGVFSRDRGVAAAPRLPVVGSDRRRTSARIPVADTAGGLLRSSRPEYPRRGLNAAPHS
jgi:protein CrcB